MTRKSLSFRALHRTPLVVYRSHLVSPRSAGRCLPICPALKKNIAFYDLCSSLYPPFGIRCHIGFERLNSGLLEHQSEHPEKWNFIKFPLSFGFQSKRSFQFHLRWNWKYSGIKKPYKERTFI